MNKFVILALVALQVAAISALPPCVCKRNYKPVCGSDGNTYSNQCRLDCESGKRNVENLTMAKEGPCKPEDVLPMCICTYEYKPVCGSDGVTYPNSCSFDCVRSDANPITVLHEGQCAEKVKVAEPIIPTCTCTREDIPVCGTNGVTYANDCLLNCATATDPSLSIKHAGSCETDSSNVPVPPCTCTRNLKPVCGSDGKTYNNDCLLNCATANDPSLSIKHAGGCESDSSNVPVPPCTCTRNLKPVCGSDGKTYNNDCLLNCATANDPSLSIKHAGGCESDSSNVPVPPCTCTRNLKPVCGSDGKTYNNDCLLNCATANDPSLSIKHAGGCETDSSNVPVPPCTCTRNLKPVCGSDGVTYNNDCLLNCATANNPSLSIAHDGEC